MSSGPGAGPHLMDNQQTLLPFGPAAATTARMVSGVRDDQLAGPTPCPDWTVADLRARARELGISGYSGKRKAELISMLRNH